MGSRFAEDKRCTLVEVEQSGFKEFDEVLDNLKDSSAKSKDYYKFIIGLATGTLIFSVTFLKELATSPQYGFILIIGWIFLFTAIVAGVLVLPMADQLHSRIQSFKGLLRSPEIIGPIVKKELHQHYLKTFIKNLIDHFFKDAEQQKTELNQFVDKLSTEDLKKFMKGLSLAGIKDTNAITFLTEFLKEIFKLLSLTKILEREASPTIIFKKLRRIILQMILLEKVMKYAFFTGIFAICLFSIINFLLR